MTSGKRRGEPVVCRGNINSYRLGCHCDDCRAAGTAAKARARANRRKRETETQAALIRAAATELVAAADIAERPGWQHKAACRGVNPDLFYPGRGQDARQAKAICATCPVINQCREAGMSERHGIWGGLSDRERRRIRARAKAVA